MSLTGYGNGDETSKCFVAFNQDFTSLAVGMKNGYKLHAVTSIDTVDTIYETDCDEVRLIERLFSSSLIALVVSSSPCTLRVCHFKRGNEICSYSYSSPILAVRLNRLRLVVCLENGLYIHNIRDMKVLHRICDTPLNPRGICSLSASSSGTDGYLAYPGSCQAGEVQIFDSIGLRAVTAIAAHNSPLAAVSFDSQGTLIATASEKGTVIRVFSVVNGGQKLFEFRRGVKRCATIYSLVFSADSRFLACTSNTETVHVFQLESPTDKSMCDSANSQGWISYFGQALRSSATYLPSQMSEVLTQARDYAVAKLPTAGVKSVCAITIMQKMPRLLVATEDGWLYVFSVDPLAAGSECTLLNRHRVDVTNVNQDALSVNKVVECLPNSDASKFESVLPTVTSPPLSSVPARPLYATVVSSPRRDGPQDWNGDDNDQIATDMSCFDEGGYCTPAEEVQTDWPTTCNIYDDREFPAVSHLSA